MMSFSTFIIKEGLKTKSVMTLHKYDTVFKSQIISYLGTHLYKAWKIASKSLKVKLHSDIAQDVRMKNSNAQIDIEVITLPIKLRATSDAGHSKTVSPSIKLPIYLSEYDRLLARQTFYDVTAEVFQQLIHDWSEIFIRISAAGNSVSDFKVKRDSRSVSLSLTFSENGIEHVINLFHVNIEQGKLNSKVRDYDILYLSIDR